jgi:hypothetical protein
MPSSTEAGAHWRTKAAEARALAERMTDPQARASMMKIAESYDHLAEIAERAAVNRPKRED